MPKEIPKEIPPELYEVQDHPTRVMRFLPQRGCEDSDAAQVGAV